MTTTTTPSVDPHPLAIDLLDAARPCFPHTDTTQSPSIQRLLHLLSRGRNLLLVSDSTLPLATLLSSLAKSLTRPHPHPPPPAPSFYGVDLTAVVAATPTVRELVAAIDHLADMAHAPDGNVVLFLGNVDVLALARDKPHLFFDDAERYGAHVGDVVESFLYGVAESALPCLASTTSAGYARYLREEAAVVEEFTAVRVEGGGPAVVGKVGEEG